MLTMADSIVPSNLPTGYDAYLGYVDGSWPTCTEIKAQHPGKQFVCLTVFGTTPNADGVDIEPGNVGAGQGVDWAKRKLAAGGNRPVLYASVGTAGEPTGYSMHEVVGLLRVNGIPRSAVRLLSAHYTLSSHICGPQTCKAIDIPMDGTQWSDMVAGNNNSRIDVSLLAEDFFSGGNVETLTAYQPGSVQLLYTPAGQLQIVGVGQDDVLYVSDLNADLSATNTLAVTHPLTFT